MDYPSNNNNDNHTALGEKKEISLLQPGLSYTAFLSNIQYQYNISKYWDNTIQYQYNTISIKIIYNILLLHTIHYNIYITLYSFYNKLFKKLGFNGVQIIKTKIILLVSFFIR